MLALLLQYYPFIEVSEATDSTPPVVTNILSLNTTANSVSINWSTDENSFSQVRYSTDYSYSNIATILGQYVTQHNINLTGLAPGTTYNYKVISVDPTGNYSVSDNNIFTTTAQATHAQADLSKIILTGDTWQTPTNVPSPVNIDGWEDSVVIDYSDNNKIYFSYIAIDAVTYQQDLEAAYLDGQTPDPQVFKRNYVNGPEREGSSGMLNTDIYEASDVGNDTWQISNLPVNDNDQNSIVEDHSPSFPADGNTIYFNRTTIGGGNDDIYKSEKDVVSGQWSSPVKEDALNDATANNGNPHVDSTGNKIFFDSDRSSGEGERDIWFSQKDGSGNWQTPQPLAVLNTPFKDWQPFITNDGNTLYFASDTLDGVSRAKASIFKSEWNGSSWGDRQLVARIDDSSQEIIGIGEPSVSANGDKLYFLYVYEREDGFYESNIAVANNPNDAPVLSPVGNKSVDEGSPLTFDLNATDADGDSLTYSATNLPQGATLVGNTFSWTPDYSQAGSYDVTFEVSDGSLSDEETITIDISNTDITAPAPFSSFSPTNLRFIADNTPLFSWNASSDNESGLDRYELYIDEVLIKTVDSNITSTEASNPLSNGRHAFYVRTYDQAGNYTQSGLSNFFIDTYKPRTSAPYSRRVKRGKNTRLYWKVKDPYTGNRAAVTLKIQKKVSNTRYETKKIVRYDWTTINRLRYYLQKFNYPGTYRFLVYARDRAGNRQYNIARNYVTVY